MGKKVKTYDLSKFVKGLDGYTIEESGKITTEDGKTVKVTFTKTDAKVRLKNTIFEGVKTYSMLDLISRVKFGASSNIMTGYDKLDVKVDFKFSNVIKFKDKKAERVHYYKTNAKPKGADKDLVSKIDIIDNKQNMNLALTNRVDFMTYIRVNGEVDKRFLISTHGVIFDVVANRYKSIKHKGGDNYNIILPHKGKRITHSVNRLMYESFYSVELGTGRKHLVKTHDGLNIYFLYVLTNGVMDNELSSYNNYVVDDRKRKEKYTKSKIDLEKAKKAKVKSNTKTSKDTDGVSEDAVKPTVKKKSKTKSKKDKTKKGNGVRGHIAGVDEIPVIDEKPVKIKGETDISKTGTEFDTPKKDKEDTSKKVDTEPTENTDKSRGNTETLIPIEEVPFVTTIKPVVKKSYKDYIAKDTLDIHNPYKHIMPREFVKDALDAKASFYVQLKKPFERYSVSTEGFVFDLEKDGSVAQQSGTLLNYSKPFVMLEDSINKKTVNKYVTKLMYETIHDVELADDKQLEFDGTEMLKTIYEITVIDKREARWEHKETEDAEFIYVEDTKDVDQLIIMGETLEVVTEHSDVILELTKGKPIATTLMNYPDYYITTYGDVIKKETGKVLPHVYNEDSNSKIVELDAYDETFMANVENLMYMSFYFKTPDEVDFVECDNESKYSAYNLLYNNEPVKGVSSSTILEVLNDKGYPLLEYTDPLISDYIDKERNFAIRLRKTNGRYIITTNGEIWDLENSKYVETNKIVHHNMGLDKYRVVLVNWKTGKEEPYDLFKLMYQEFTNNEVDEDFISGSNDGSKNLYNLTFYNIKLTKKIEKNLTTKKEGVLKGVFGYIKKIFG